MPIQKRQFTITIDPAKRREAKPKPIKAHTLNLLPLVAVLGLHATLSYPQLIWLYVGGILLVYTLLKWMNHKLLSPLLLASSLALVTGGTALLFEKPFFEEAALGVVMLFTAVISRNNNTLSTLFQRQRKQNPLVEKDWMELCFISLRTALCSGILVALHLLVPMAEVGILHYIAPMLLSGIILYEVIRVYLLNQIIQKEPWLPILDKEFRITGYIPRSQSLASEEMLCHPHLRNLICCKERIYLVRNNTSNRLFEWGIDTPISEDIEMGHSLPESLNRHLKQLLTPGDYTATLLLTHLVENAHARRCVYLTLVEVDNEESISNHNPLLGKFWSFEQIESSLGKDTFTPLFEEEFRFISNTLYPTKPTDESL